MKATEEVIESLNRALQLDPEGISALFQFRVQLNRELLDSDLPFVVNQNDELSALGLLNGLLDDAKIRIGAVVDEHDPDGCIIQRFVPVSRQESSHVEAS